MGSIAFSSSPFTHGRYRVSAHTARNVRKCVRRAAFRASATTDTTPTTASLSVNEIESKTPPQQVGGGDVDLELGDVTSVDDINAIMQLADEFDIADLRLESGGVAVEITREGGRGFVDGVLREEPEPTPVAMAPRMYEMAPTAYSEPSTGAEPESEVEEVPAIEPEPISTEAVAVNNVATADDSDPNVVYDSDFVVKSNRVGFFFSGARNKPPLVNVGDHVAFNQPICIIEQLGQQYVYLAEVSGTITKVFVEDGDAVQFDDQVMVIRPD